jgi:uncharacterized protein YdeI (YjbR/CyaY-like superfamily)
MTQPMGEPIIFFPSAGDFHAWLESHHTDTREQWVGFFKKESGKPSVTYPESVDEALCFGWIDGLRQKIDEESYRVRFTPRNPGSLWSPVNISRVAELTSLGRMQPAGLAAFKLRKEKAFGEFSYANRRPDMPEPYASLLKQNTAAWEFYVKQPPSYRKVVNWYVVSVKKEETRLKHLAELIESCEAGKLIPAMEKMKSYR